MPGRANPTGTKTHFFLAVTFLFFARVTSGITLKARYPEGGIRGKYHRCMRAV